MLVATDDPRRIAAAVESFGGRFAPTRRDHLTGTDRVAEVASRLDADVIINLQGERTTDRPAASSICWPSGLRRDRGANLATLAVPLSSA